MYDAREVTNWFIERAAVAGEPLDIMALLKLVYIAHGWHLAKRSKPLFSNRIEAWPYGPVVPAVYNTFRPKGVVLERTDPGYHTVEDGEDASLLRWIYDTYGKMSAWDLSDLTHVPGGPWETAMKWGGPYAEIPNELIEAHYISQMHRRGNEQRSTTAH